MIKSVTDKTEEAKKIFIAYLETNKQRKTPERYAILEEIYRRNDHFDADDLFLQMKSNDYNISRATIYNTLELLVDCDLVSKHQFGDNIAKYEKAFGYKQHDHVICVECKQVMEFCDPRIQQIKDMVSSLTKFKISHHSLNLYGLCANCQEKSK